MKYVNEYGHDRVHMEIPYFQGQQWIEEVLDWFYEIEILEHGKVKIVVIRFKYVAVVWWEHTKAGCA